MVEAILKIFVSEQQVEAVLTNPLVELIFAVLFIKFAVTIIIHFLLFSKLKRIRQFVSTTRSLNIEPLNKFHAEFEYKNKQEALKVDTFIQRKFSSWRVYNIPVVSLIKIIQATVSLFILIGVLGTFIGLAMSLSSIDAVGDGLVESVGLVLSGLDVAFYTSIVGMSFSLIMTIVTKVANNEYMLTDIMLKVESYLEETEPDALSRLINVSETINSSIVELRETNKGVFEAFKGFQQYSVGLQQSAKDLAKFNEGLSENLQDFKVVFDGVSELTAGFDCSVKQLNKNFEQLFSYFYKMDQRNEKMTAAFTETYQKISELTNTQADTLDQFLTSVVDLKEFFANMSNRQQSIHTSLERIYSQSDQLVKLMAQNNHQYKAIFGTDLSGKLGRISTYLRDLKGDFDKLGSSIVRLPDALDTLHIAQSDYKNLLKDRLDELRQFSHNFQQHINSHSSLSHGFDKQLVEATRSFEQIAMKNNQYLSEMNRMLQQIQHREKDLESSVDVMKNILSTYVQNLEGTLGDKLDKISRNIGDYAVDVNEALKKELKHLSEISEDSQERNTRSLQQVIHQLVHEFQSFNRQLQAFSSEARTKIKVGSND